jgi:ketosteroid isomerase-like protein
MRVRVWILAALTTAVVGACAQQPTVDKAAEEAAIREVAEGELLNAARAGDLDGVLGAYAETAVMMPPGAPSERGLETLRMLWASFLELPGVDIRRMDEAVIQVSDSGDMAYSIGGFQLGYMDSEGNALVEQGKHVRVWQKDADGAWKIAVDIWNANP